MQVDHYRLPMRREHRHPSEVPLLIAGLILVVVVAPIVAVLVWEAFGLGVLAVLVGTYLALVIGRGFILAAERARSVKVGPDQFPDVWDRIVHYAGVYGLHEVPDAWVVQEGGTLNAFASKHGRRNFIRINADIFEVGTTDIGPRAKDPAALDFVIAHELGHVAASHTTYWYAYLSSFIFSIPLLGSAQSRAREYTADNWAHSVVPDGEQGIVMLSSGKYLYPMVDGRAIAARADDPDAFVWAVNALSTHPIQTKRLAALYDRSKPGKLF